ncbi:MAG: ATP-binding cassette domain-containing protein [Bacteroidales bacterium]|jgi:ABC-2 type transport system ATP-binding protein|nr:ATP-binding cassette domain-containing protein [Bacteroidales bacterium]
MNYLECQNIVKQYSNHRALDDASISVPKGSIFGLLGPNGAGKTSLIRIINQITMPDSGTILFNGEKLGQKHIRSVGYLPEERGLYKKMKVGEQAIYFARLRGMDKATAHEKLLKWFRKFEIASWWDKKVEELSKGMQQKIQFIVTIVHEPELLIFDEPFSGFDPINVDLLKKEILELKEQGRTIIFSTHNMSSVEELCDDICLINQGKNILSGEINEVRNSFNDNLVEIKIEHSLENLETLLPAGVAVLNEKQNNLFAQINLQTSPAVSTNDIIAALLPYARIISFQERLPSMHDIFVQEVKKMRQP